MGPLNAVLKELRDWKQPTLMLVGNHDQVRTSPILLVLAWVSTAMMLLHAQRGPRGYAQRACQRC